ncbi:MAG: cytochrome P450 [Myxococcota bacterium]
MSLRAPLCSADPKEALSLAVIESPHAFYARLRETHPLSRIGESGVHLVASWDLIEEALSREEDFSAHLTGVLIRDAEGEPAPFLLPMTGATQVIATADEPEHSIHRGVVQPRLSPARIAALEGQLRNWTQQAVSNWKANGAGDIAPLCERIPALALAHVLGLPESDVERFRVWAMMGGDMLAGDASAERLGVLAQETAQMAAYLSTHLENAQHAKPEPENEDGTLLQSLAQAVARGALSAEAALGISIVLFGAAGESTAALLGSCARWLAENPELQGRLEAEPKLIPRFVEEIVRLEPPFKFHYRSVTRDCTLAGFTLREGDRLMLLWASANRDPAVFEEPDKLLLDRRFPKRHMGFGRGSHFCVGATLARLEARIFVETLLESARDDLRRGPAESAYAKSIFVRRLERLSFAST